MIRNNTNNKTISTEFAISLIIHLQRYFVVLVDTYIYIYIYNIYVTIPNMASTSFALPNTNKILAISKSATLSSNNNDNNSNNKTKNTLQISSPTSFLPSVEDMKEKTIQNLKAAIEFKNMLHRIQRSVFEAYTRKFLVEFLETDDGKLAIRRIDKVIVPMSIKASSMADAPIVEDSSLKRTSKFPSYINKRVVIV